MNENPLAVYVHWPFCQSKCPYCDFNSHVAEAVHQDRWRRALLAELDHFAAQTAGRAVGSLFFGGGTPSLMDPGTVAAVIDAVKGHWRVAPDLEVTLEANPSSVEAGRFAAYAAAGVNRLSLGVQSFDDGALRFLGRIHSGAAARAAVAIAQESVPRVSLDLIYALPGQTVADWRRQLDAALAFGTEHLSLYQLTIEPGTPFAQDGVEPAAEDPAADLFDLTQEVLNAAGLPAYEISNHATPGTACRHNLVYWRGGDYLGVGPGAHGRLGTGGGTAALHQIRQPERWLDAVEKRGHGTVARRILDPADRIEELLMMGLRLTEGVGWDRFHRLTGASLKDVLDPGETAFLIEQGFLELDRAGLRATAAGRLRLNALLARLFSALNT